VRYQQALLRKSLSPLFVPHLNENCYIFIYCLNGDRPPWDVIPQQIPDPVIQGRKSDQLYNGGNLTEKIDYDDNKQRARIPRRGRLSVSPKRRLRSFFPCKK
jgi:hypothetical protein